MNGYLVDTSSFVAAEQRRETTYNQAIRFLALPYEQAVGEHVAQLLATARAPQRKAGAMGVIIAATALAHDVVIWTQDSDFGVLQELAPAQSVHPG